MSKLYGILANPAKHSLSPVMYNAAFQSLKIDAHYDIFEVAEDDLKIFFEKVRNGLVSGLSVSLPYKEKVIPFLDKVNEDAQRIGAVNTIINVDGFLYGFNTDYLASNKALVLDLSYKDAIPIKDPVAVVIGAGGAARAVCYGLLKLGMHVWIANRTKSRADRIAIDFAEIFNTEIHSVDLDNLGYGDILINTTSIWTQNPDISEEELPYFCSPEYVDKFKVVMDISYKPWKTPLVMCAMKLGKHVVTGDKMLLYQAVDQFELFTEQKAPEEVMRKALEAALGAG